MTLSPVLGFARLAFLDLLAYRLRYVVGILNYVIYMGVQYFLWSAVYASAAGGASAAGAAGAAGAASAAGAAGADGLPLPLDVLVTYFAVGWIVRASSYNNVDREIADRVSRGDIVLDLLRPASLLAMRYGQAAGEVAFRAAFMGLPTALIFFPLFGVRGPALPGDLLGAGSTLLAFAASVVLAFHLFFLMNFAIGVSTVFLEKIQGFLWAKFMLVQLLSGLLVPFELFPGWARAVLEALPFRGMMYAPISIYSGLSSGAGIAGELGIQAAWTVALWGFARWVWARARRRLSVQGG